MNSFRLPSRGCDDVDGVDDEGVIVYVRDTLGEIRLANIDS